jgi:3-phosphoshikimate 1-carboxyvinyltransferase
MKKVSAITVKNCVFEAPPAKAYTLRALILAALASGNSTIHRPLMAHDQVHMIECLRGLGIKIIERKEKLVITGGGGRFKPTVDQLFVGESGVTCNILCSAANLSDSPLTLTGAPRILERPIGEVISGMRQLGCAINYLGEDGFPPVRLAGGGVPGGRVEMHGAKTSQYFSSMAITAACADADVHITCLDEMTERPYFDITLEMMNQFGVTARNNDYRTITIPSGQQYSGKDITIEGDYSSASFFFMGAAITGSKLSVTGLNVKSLQGDKAFLDILEMMGCAVKRTGSTIVVKGTPLKAVKMNMVDIPDLLPPAAVTAAFADGTSTFTRVGHLRHKECDRLEVVREGLEKMGVNAWYDDDSFYVEGNKESIHGTTIDPYNDHRIAMSFAMAGLVTGNQLIEDESCVSKSFPDFWEKMDECFFM